MSDTEKMHSGSGGKQGMPCGKRCLIAFVVILIVVILVAVGLVLALYVFAPHKLDPCKSNPCYNGATCHMLVSSVSDVTNHRFNCTCAVGFTGSNCTIITSLNVSGSPLIGYAAGHQNMLHILDPHNDAESGLED